MYSIIESGGLQYKVTLGESLKVPRIDAEVGVLLTSYNFDQIGGLLTYLNSLNNCKIIFQPLD